MSLLLVVFFSAGCSFVDKKSSPDPGEKGYGKRNVSDNSTNVSDNSTDVSDNSTDDKSEMRDAGAVRGERSTNVSKLLKKVEGLSYCKETEKFLKAYERGDKTESHGEDGKPMIYHVFCDYSSFNLEERAQLVHIAKKSGLDVNSTDDEGNNALHIKCSNSRAEAEDISHLIEAGVNLNHQNEDGETPLLVYCKECSGNDWNREAVKLMVDKGADPNIMDKHYRKPIYYVSGFKSKADKLLPILLPKTSASLKEFVEGGGLAEKNTMTEMLGWGAKPKYVSSYLEKIDKLIEELLKNPGIDRERASMQLTNFYGKLMESAKGHCLGHYSEREKRDLVKEICASWKSFYDKLSASAQSEPKVKEVVEKVRVAQAA